VAVLGHTTLTLEDLNEDTGLVVSVGSEGLGLLGGDDGVSGDKNSHNTTSGLDTLGKRNDIEEEKILNLLGLLTVEDSGLDGGTISDGLIRVDGSVELLAVEEVGEHLLNLGDTSGTADKDDLVDLGLGDISILEDHLNWWHAISEEVVAKLLELGTSQRGGVILTFSKCFALNLGLVRAGKDSLGLLALGAETAESSGITSNVEARLQLEIVDAKFEDLVVEVHTT
jgi:hypothetical protein